MTAVAIRRAAARDRARLRDLFQALNRHEDRLVGDRRTDRAGAEESLAASEQRVAETGGAFLVAVLAGQVVGALALVFEEGPVYLRPEARAHAHIADLVVDADFRRQGIGRALMRAAEKEAVERGYRQLSIGVLAGNSAAEAAYARQGFRIAGLELFKEIGKRDKKPR